MKRLAVIICTVIFVTLLGCAPKQSTQNQQGANKNSTTNQNTTTTTYKDGVFEAFGDKWQYGQESAIVTIKGGKMTDINLKRLDANGKEVNYDEWVGQKEANGSVKPNLKQYRLDMAKRMIDKQTYQVDTIAGATQSSSGWKVAVQRALDKAK